MVLPPSEAPKVQTGNVHLTTSGINHLASSGINQRDGITSSKYLHRKVPSLYLKKDYSSNLQAAHQSRQGSVERGVANISKENLNTSNSRGYTSGRITITDGENFKTAGAVKVNNFLSGAGNSKPTLSLHERAISTKPIPKPSSRVPDLISTQQITMKPTVHHHSNASSVDKLKNTFSSNWASPGSHSVDEKEKVNRVNQSSTRCNEQETTILWRDDIVLDIEQELTFTSVLGQGSFAKVYEGYDKKLKMGVAIKVIDKRKITEPKRRALIQTEVNILGRMKHKNIAELYRLVEDHKRVFVVMQLCGNLTLNVFCRQFNDKRLNDEQAFAIFSQIVKGVKYMHDHNVAHRDLKLTNILIDEDYAVKVIDFGFACEANETHKMYCGTPSYMAPEIVEKKQYMPKPSDIWSLGVVLYKLLSGEYAFGGKGSNNRS